MKIISSGKMNKLFVLIKKAYRDLIPCNTRKLYNITLPRVNGSVSTAAIHYTYPVYIIEYTEAIVQYIIGLK